MTHRPRQNKFHVENVQELIIDRPAALKDFYILSPFVWKEGNAYQLLMRMVNRSQVAAEKVARIHYGRGFSKKHFVLEAIPVVKPGPGEDRDGSEDPTLAKIGDTYYVYYSGWNQEALEVCLLLATGSDLRRLQKRGTVLPKSERFRNTKEATIVRCADKTWRLFFEFAEDDKSKIGVARSDNINGPWHFIEPLFEARPDNWDSWHLSTGPISLTNPERPLMFYNGANRDARWRIGWIEFDAEFEAVTARCDDPLIRPPEKPREPEDTDIAFAASAVVEPDHVGLYYSVADRWVELAEIRPV